MKHLRILCLTAALVALAACQQFKSSSTTASQSSPATSSPSVATVDGTPISRDLYEFYIKGVTGKTSGDLSPEQRSQALDNLIRAELIAHEAEQEGLNKQPATAQLMKMERLNILEQALSQKFLAGKQPSDDELKAEYDAEVAKMPTTEYHARHILVATEPFAPARGAPLRHRGRPAGQRRHGHVTGATPRPDRQSRNPKGSTHEREQARRRLRRLRLHRPPGLRVPARVPRPVHQRQAGQGPAAGGDREDPGDRDGRARGRRSRPRTGRWRMDPVRNRQDGSRKGASGHWFENCGRDSALPAVLSRPYASACSCTSCDA